MLGLAVDPFQDEFLGGIVIREGLRQLAQVLDGIRCVIRDSICCLGSS
jgi:hypothetical protein